MAKPLVGKRFFRWLGYMDKKAGLPLLSFQKPTSKGRLWPLWARASYTVGWLDRDGEEFVMDMAIVCPQCGYDHGYSDWNYPTTT